MPRLMAKASDATGQRKLLILEIVVIYVIIKAIIRIQNLEDIRK